MGGLKLNAVFSNGMVLQRGKEIKIWGQCPENAAVTVTIGKHSAEASVSGGAWEAILPTMQASESETLTVNCGDESISIENVAIGEVWIAGGQSNMEMAMELDAEAVDETDADPLLRFFDVPKISYDGQENDEDYSDFGFWREYNAKNAPFFSATGYYFAKKLRKALNVPVGIVGCNCGGTSASCWLPEPDLKGDPELNEYLIDYHKGLEGMDLEKFRRDYIAERRRKRLPEERAFSRRLMMGTLTESEMAEIMRHVAEPVVGPVHHYRPTALYHTMLMTIAPYTARGVIWYQGESDDKKPHMYAKLFTAVINRWRSDWRDELPFLFVQLAPFESWLGCRGSNFPEVRRQQEIVSKTVAGTHMASIMDSGERLDIHPKHKRPAGERLSRLALSKVYGLDVPCDAPEAVSCAKTSGGVEINFTHTGGGLELKGDTLNALQIFTEAGESTAFTARVTGNSIAVETCENVAEVRFAWTPYAEVNLYGNEGMCAKPFRFKL